MGIQIKRIGYLYEKIIDENNIEKAIFNASRRKKNRPDVIWVMSNFDEKVKEIKKILVSGSYKTSPYSEKVIIDNSSGKKREIKRPKFYPDQCIQWSVMQVIEPILSKGHYFYSCGSVPGKGGHFAKSYIEKWVRRDFRNTKYVMQIDITKFYPSVNHDILKSKLSDKIKCRRTLSLLDEIIGGGEEGLPIGNYTSQWLANFYLQRFDHYVKQELKCKYYVRYMDDIVIFGSNKRKMHRDFVKIENKLNSIGLKAKGNWQIFKFDSRPLDFLGYKFYRTHTTIRKRNSLRIKRRAKKIGKKEKLTFQDASAILSYMGWIKHSDSIYFYNNHIKPYVNIGEAKEVVRNESKKRHKTRQIQN